MTEHPGTKVPHPYSPKSHPSPAVLAAHHGGELSEAEAEAVRQHLVGCEICLESVLALSRLEEQLRSAVEPSTDPAMARSLAELQKRRWKARSTDSAMLLGPPHREPTAGSQPVSPGLGAELPPPGQPTQPPSPAPGRWQNWAQAALVLLCVGLSGLVWSQRRDLEELSSPVGNPGRLTFNVGSNTRGGSETLAPGTGLSVQIQIGPEFEHTSYRAALAPGDGKAEPESVDGLALERGGVLTIFFPRPLLHPGIYTLEVSGVDEAGRETLLDTFDFRLELER